MLSARMTTPVLLGYMAAFGSCPLVLAHQPLCSRQAQQQQQQQQQQFSTVRGRIDRQDTSGKVYPAQYTRVILTPLDSASTAASFYTGSDGLYYFYKVNPGSYQLSIPLTSGKPIV